MPNDRNYTLSSNLRPPSAGVLTHALRDMRGSLRHLRLLCICLCLGVAVMSCIGSMISGIRTGIDRDAKSLLGGDIEIRQLYEEASFAAIAYMQFHSQAVSQTVDMRAMAESLPENGDGRTLIELKGIDRNYPLYGDLELRDAQEHIIPRQQVFASVPKSRLYGAAVDRSFLEAMHLKIGQRFKTGDVTFEIRAVIASEPDRIINSLSLGPRVMAARAAFPATGLVRAGSLIYYRYRLQLAEGTDLAQWKRGLSSQFPTLLWSVRDWHDSAPGLTTLIDRLALFFALTGITTLVVAGIGIANAANVYMWSKRQTIAIMKCLGAGERYVHRVYLVQLLIAGSAAIACGLLVGSAGEIALLHYFNDMLPVRGESGIYGLPLLLSAGLGLLTLLLFALLPLQQLRIIKPASLFRGHVDAVPPLSLKDTHTMATMAILTACMIALAVLFTGIVKIPLYFAGGLLAALSIFYAIAAVMRRFALKNAHNGRFRLTTGMALANLARPGAATTSMVAALGIGTTLLIALALVGSNLRSQVEQGLPEHAPAFFLVDIQPSVREKLLDKLKTIPQVSRVSDLPMVRGRIIKLNGIPVSRLHIEENARWALQSDRGLTWAAAAPTSAPVVQGAWWGKDYHGAPLVSFDATLARGMGLKLGDTITITALDQEITATITSFRDIEWGTMEMNFAIVLSPGALDNLPTTYIATVTAPPAGEAPVQAMMKKDFPDVAVIHVRDALGKISLILSRISNAVLVTAAMTILCGILVMASAIHASLHKRIFDTVMLKVLGVTRKRILRIYLTEFVLVALAAALASVVLGSLAAWGVMQLMIFSRFVLMPSVVVLTLAASLLVAIILGLAATRATLGVRPLSLLRNE